MHARGRAVVHRAERAGATHLGRNLLEHLLLRLGAVGARAVLFEVEAILWSGLAVAGRNWGRGLRTAKALQDARGLVALFVEGCGPESLRAEFVGQAIDGRAKFVDPSVELVEAGLASGLCLLPEGHDAAAGMLSERQQAG